MTPYSHPKNQNCGPVNFSRLLAADPNGAMEDALPIIDAGGNSDYRCPGDARSVTFVQSYLRRAAARAGCIQRRGTLGTEYCFALPRRAEVWPPRRQSPGYLVCMFPLEAPFIEYLTAWL